MRYFVILLLFVACKPVHLLDGIKTPSKQKNEAIERLGYLKDRYPSLFEGENITIEYDTINQLDTIVIDSILIDRVVQKSVIRELDTIRVFNKDSSAITTVFISLNDTITQYRIITQLDSFRVIERDTIRVPFKVYVQESRKQNSLIPLVFLSISSLCVLVFLLCIVYWFVKTTSKKRV